jgi:hypothetical protein
LKLTYALSGLWLWSMHTVGGGSLSNAASAGFSGVEFEI